MMNQEVIKFIQEALECSVYIAPKEPGLTFDEVLEIGKKIGLQAGEIGDALPFAAKVYIGVKMLLPSDNAMAAWCLYFPEIPDYRNFAAFDFVVSQLNTSVRAEGARNARLERTLIVERAVAQHIPRNDIEVAITMQVIAGQLTDDDGVLRFPSGPMATGTWASQRNTSGAIPGSRHAQRLTRSSASACQGCYRATDRWPPEICRTSRRVCGGTR
jgi:hypothetical protein